MSKPKTKCILFFREECFYPTEYPADYNNWQAEADRNPGTLRIEDAKGKVLWSAPVLSGRPSDVPQNIWDEAERLDVETSAFNPSAAEIIARAIMAAKAEEREACATIADKIGAARSRQCSEARAAKKRSEGRDFESMAMSAIDVGYAIRKRGDVITAHKTNQGD